jgi:restriction endonuclease S subunit
MTQKIDLNNLDKSSWETFKFEDIAQKISKTVKPDEALVDIYVGLEHIDANDIHIRRKGVPADVKGGKLRCYPGDVIFGKRRAYQRKAAIVDFDGICSAHAFVFRPNKEIIDSKLFPFFLHSDQFMHRMVDISVGGLSPTINWGDLKQQEFLLPPKEQQTKIAELLWVMDEVAETENQTVINLDNYRNSIIENFVAKNLDWINDDWKKVKLESILFVPKKTKAKKIDRNKLITVRLHRKGVIKNENTGGLRIGATTYYIRKAGQFIYGKQNLHNGALGIVPIELDGFLTSSDIPTLDINIEKVMPEFIEILIGRKTFYKYLEKYSAGSGAKRISEKVLLEIKIDLPPIETQEKFIHLIKTINTTFELSQSKISSSKALQKSLINQVF